MRKSARLALLGAVALFCATKSHAIVSTSIEPIVGYERVELLVPTRRTKERIVYGARVVVGLPLVSGEGEVTRAQSLDAFPATNSSVDNTTDKARLGLRSTFRLSSFISAFVRAGAQASRSTDVVTTAGVPATTVNPIAYQPYGGGGVRVRLGKNLSFTGDVTAVFRSFPDMNQNDYMTTASLAISFP